MTEIEEMLEEDAETMELRAMEHLLAGGEDEGITMDLLKGLANRYLREEREQNEQSEGSSRDEASSSSRQTEKDAEVQDACPKCCICLEEKSVTDIAQLTPTCTSEHCVFCTQCITGFLHRCMKSNWWYDINRPICPKCKETLPDDTIKKYVSAEMFDK